MTWINASSDGTINRANGVTVTWTGGAAGTYVHITGSASTGSGFSAYFICNAPASAGTFTVPPGVLLALPAGSGGLEVSDYTNPQPFTATPLDFAFAEAFTSTSINATYN